MSHILFPATRTLDLIPVGADFRAMVDPATGEVLCLLDRSGHQADPLTVDPFIIARAMSGARLAWAARADF